MMILSPLPPSNHDKLRTERQYLNISPLLKGGGLWSCLYSNTQMGHIHPHNHTCFVLAAHDGSELFCPPIYVKEDENRMWKHHKFN